MGRLVPADELPNAFLDPYGRPVAELAFGSAEVGRGQPHVTGLVAVALDVHLAPQRSPDQIDQPVEAHALPTADVDGLGDAPPPPAVRGRPVHSKAERTPSTQSVI